MGGRFKRLTVCLLKNEPATYRQWQVKAFNARSHSESESEEGDIY